MSLLDRNLPEPHFIDRDAARITADLVAAYEYLTNKTLYPAQVERLQINNFAYRETLLREAIQDAGKLNLVRYSRAPILDYLGENIGVARLDAGPANTILRFEFDALPTSTVMPAGARVGEDPIFATSADHLVASGASVAEIYAECLVDGEVGNGFAAGQINGLVEAVAGFNITSAQNITITADGAEAEDDDHLRERIVLAIETFSSTGPADAYKYWALSAHRDIVDVAIDYPRVYLDSGAILSSNGVPPGVVYLYPLTRDGLPSQAIKDLVLQACSLDKRRPLTDYVEVKDPVQVDYSIEAELTLYKNADANLALVKANDAIASYVSAREQKLGYDIVREQLTGVFNAQSQYGVYRVNLIKPAASQILSGEKLAHCTGVTLTVAGREDG